MSNILVVGNVIKDVYINLDARTENYEVDSTGTKWLNLAFDATDHHFFRRNSSFGGAAISLEVLQKMGLNAEINGSQVAFGDDGIVAPDLNDIYRYILVADETQISYLTPSTSYITRFIAPRNPVDYIYIDRSVELTDEVVSEIECYLRQNPATKLALYYKKNESFHERKLLTQADLVFAEEKLTSVPSEKLVIISDKELKYQNITEPIALKRPDLSTHLSLYSTAAATILGAHILGRSLEEGLKLARANVENSKLDATLELRQMEYLVDTPTTGGSSSLELVARSLKLDNKTVFDLSTEEPTRKEVFAAQNIPDTYSSRQDYYTDFLKKAELTRRFTGVALTDEALEQFTDDGRSFVDFLTDQRIVPGVVFKTPSRIDNIDCRDFVARFIKYHEHGVRFLKWQLPSGLNKEMAIKTAMNFAHCANEAGLVPVFDSLNLDKGLTSEIISQVKDQGDVLVML